MQHNSNPTVDVIIPVYNGARFLAEAIDSVLAQSYAQLVVTVVDDGSVDDSAAVAARFSGVRIFQQPNRGLGAALNLALHQTHNSLLASLDADDRWLPDKLEKQISALMANPELDMIFSYVRQFHQAGESGGSVQAFEAPQPGISRCSMLVHRAAFDRVGYFAEDRGVNAFLDWYARAGAAGLRWDILRDVVYERRIHQDNMGRQMREEEHKSYLTALRMAIQRRRSSEQAGS